MEKEKRRFNPRPMLLGAIGAVSGVLLSVSLPAEYLPFLALLSLLFAVFLFLREKPLFALPLLLGLCLLRGCLLPRDTLLPGGFQVEGTVISLPEESKEGVTVKLAKVTLNGSKISGKGELLLPEGTRLSYGQRLKVFASLTPVTLMESAGSGLVFEAEALSSPALSRGSACPVRLWGLLCRQKLEQWAKALFKEESGVASGMLFGDKSSISYLTYRDYQKSGLAHLLTVSGLHAGIVCGCVLKLIRGKRRWLRFLASAGVLLLFCFLTGFSPSTLRAALMLLCFLLCRILERQEDPLTALSLALALLLLVNPLYLFSRGFQLSFATVFGILTLSPQLKKPLKKLPDTLGSLIAGSIAAFAGSAPLLCLSFGGVNLLSIPASLTVLPVMPLFLIPGWLSVLLYPLLPKAAALLALLPRGVLAYCSAVAGLFARPGLALPAPGALALVAWYISLFFLSPCYLPNRKAPPYIGWAAMALSLLLWAVL